MAAEETPSSVNICIAAQKTTLKLSPKTNSKINIGNERKSLVSHDVVVTVAI